jgi:hypothetical protein
MTLNVLKPVAITQDAQLLSTNATDSTDAVWAVGTTYADGAKVKYNHYRYESLQGTNLGKNPSDPANIDWWLNLGPTNWWACLDTRTSTSTTNTGSLVVTIKPNAVINSIAVLGISGTKQVQVKVYDGPGRTETGGPTGTGNLIYYSLKTLDNTFISNWYQWLFEPYAVFTDLLFGALQSATLAGGIPPFYSCEVVVTLTGNTGGSTVGCAGIMLGTAVEIGSVQYGATAGITDYSVKETDAYGETTLVERGFSDRANYTINVEKSQIRRVHSTLTALRATPCVWVATDDYDYSPLTVYGYPKEFSLNVGYPTFSTYSLEIEGLT